MNKKSQVALEFIIIASLVAITFVVASTSLFLFIKNSTQQKESEALKEIGDILFKEVTIARNVQDNYRRYFSLPKNVEGVDYAIDVGEYVPPYSNNSEVTFYFSDQTEKSYQKVVFLYGVDVLSLSKECNLITKVNGKIEIRKIKIDGFLSPANYKIYKELLRYHQPQYFAIFDEVSIQPDDKELLQIEGGVIQDLVNKLLEMKKNKVKIPEEIFNRVVPFNRENVEKEVEGIKVDEVVDRALLKIYQLFGE